MLRSNLILTFFLLTATYFTLHAQAIGFKVQENFAKLSFHPGPQDSIINSGWSWGGGFFLEDRLNDHDVFGVELSGVRVVGRVTSRALSNPVTRRYYTHTETKTQYVVLNGYYRHIRDRWGIKGGLQLMVPAVEVVQTSYTGDYYLEEDSDFEIGPEYAKLGFTTGIDFAIDKYIRLSFDYYNETSHLTSQRNQSYYRAQIFSAGIKFSFVKSRYKFT